PVALADSLSVPTRRSSDLANVPFRPRFQISSSLSCLNILTRIGAEGDIDLLDISALRAAGIGCVALLSTSRTLETQALSRNANADRKSTRLNSSHVKISYA